MSAYQTTRKERFAFPMFTMGLNSCINLINGFVLLFYTDFLFLPAAALAVIMLLVRVFDAVTDPMFGVIFDKLNLKGGKFRPWLRVGMFAVPVTTFMIFAVPPDMSVTARLALVVLSYLIADVAQTITSTPGLSSLSVITSNTNERTKLVGYIGVADILGMIIVSVILVPQIERIGFMPVAAIVATIAFFAMATYPFVIRERSRETAKIENNYRLRDILTFFKKNKYLLHFYGFICVFGIFSIPLAPHVILHGLGSLDYIAIFTLISIPLLLVVYLTIPSITKKIDRMKLFKYTMFALVFVILAMYFAGYSNPVVLGVFFVIRNTIFMASVALAVTFAADFVELGHFKTGMRQEGLTFSAHTFAIKVMLAASGALAALVLALIGYDGTLEVQPVESVDMLWLASNGVPVIGLLLGLPLLLRCKFLCSDIQIMADVNSGKISREEGLGLLSREY